MVHDVYMTKECKNHSLDFYEEIITVGTCT